MWLFSLLKSKKPSKEGKKEEGIGGERGDLSIDQWNANLGFLDNFKGLEDSYPIVGIQFSERITVAVEFIGIDAEHRRHRLVFLEKWELTQKNGYFYLFLNPHKLPSPIERCLPSETLTTALKSTNYVTELSSAPCLQFF